MKLDLSDIAARIPGAVLKDSAVSVPLADGMHTVELARDGTIWLYNWSAGTVMRPPKHAAKLKQLSPALAAWKAAEELEAAVGEIAYRLAQSEDVDRP